MTSSDRVIGVIQPFVPTYRVGLFDAIAERLERHDLTLEVWHAQPRGRVAARGNATIGPWSVPIQQHRLSVGTRNVTFRAIHARARRARAVIAGLASTNVETYGLALDPAVRLMLWGHGRNYTAENSGLDARVEGFLRGRSKHIFVYTNSGRDHLIAVGDRPEDITVVQNSTDTTRLHAALGRFSADDAAALRRELQIENHAVGLFVGAFDAPKKLPLLIEATDLIHRERSDFVLLMAGAGPDEAYVREAAASRDYVRFIGRANPDRLAHLSTLADIVMMPGRVGLVAVDALALGLPVATTTFKFHAPEADYLRPGIDSIWTDMSATAYAAGVLEVLASPARLQALSAEAALRGQEFSVEKSADNFVAGVLTGLER
jgi:glycosyltransferase involved in cell wall biosynthesis